MPRNKVSVLNRPFYTLAVTNGTTAELTLYGEIVTERPTDWWGDPIDGDFIILDEFLKDLETIKGCTDLTIRLNSIGGDAFAAFTIHNRLRDLKARKTCIVDGVAMSGGSHIMCACDTVKVNPSSIVMIHDCLTFAFGRLNSADCAELAKQLDVVDQAQAEIYARKTGKTVEELRALMDETTYLTGRQAVEQGFADELIEDAEDPDISVSADKKTIYAHGHPMRFAALGELPDGIKVVESAPVTLPTHGDGDGEDNTPEASGMNGGREPMTLEEFRQENPEAAAALLAEAQASVNTEEAVQAAVIAERQRLSEIDAIASLYTAEMVNAAKYGDSACTAQEMTYRAALESVKQGTAFAAASAADYQESGADGIEANHSEPIEDTTNRPLTAEERKQAGKAAAMRLRGEKKEEV